jgi:uncharacterized membrane protein (DUF2068 family)
MTTATLRTRTTEMTVLGVLFGLLAISNLLKPVAQMMSPDGPEGLVFFGHRLHGLANAIMAPLFGALLAAYAYGIWTAKRWIVPIAVAYAIYVPLNLFLFTTLQATDAEKGKVVFNLVYFIVAVGASAGAAVYFTRNRERLS